MTKTLLRIVVVASGNLGEKPWGYKEFSAKDEVGNSIVFAEEIERVEKKL